MLELPRYSFFLHNINSFDCNSEPSTTKALFCGLESIFYSKEERESSALEPSQHISTVVGIGTAMHSSLDAA